MLLHILDIFQKFGILLKKEYQFPNKVKMNIHVFIKHYLNYLINCPKYMYIILLHRSVECINQILYFVILDNDLWQQTIVYCSQNRKIALFLFYEDNLWRQISLGTFYKRFKAFENQPKTNTTPCLFFGICKADIRSANVE